MFILLQDEYVINLNNIFFFFVSWILYNAFDDFDMLARLFSYKNEIINCALDEDVDY